MTGLTGFGESARERLGEAGFAVLPDAPGMRRAAVVLCVVEQDGAPGVLVIKRAYRGRNAGQWGLPGGRVDEGETLEAAALRELREELAIEVGPSEIVGRLDDFPASSGFAISPFVAVVDRPVVPVPSPDEVHSVHHVPLARLAAADAVTWADHPSGGRLLQMTLGPRMTIHAPTGAILWQFRESVLLGRDVRVADLLQPDWTRH